MGIAEYHWEQLEGGPNKAHLTGDLKAAAANATGLTKGKYDFRLTVKDDLGNADSDDVTVTVAQDENEAPVADAGGGRDMADVTLPADSILFNGSASHDDFRITRWEWTRLDSSPAAGDVVGNTWKEPVLYLVNAVG